MRSSNSFRRILLVSALAGAAAMTVSRSAAQDKQPVAAEPSSAAAQPPAQPEGDYVGTEVCVTCHADQEKSFVHTIMGNAMAHARTPLEKLGCEACHGPGKAHVEAGGGKDTIPVRFTKDSNTPVEERNAACLSCHTKGNQMFWSGSPHESRAMACVDCHQVHYGSPAERYAALASVRFALRSAADRTRRHQEAATGVVPAVPPDAAGAVAALLAHAVSRGQSHLHQLPQPAWQPESEPAVTKLDQRELPQLPYRTARPVSVGASSGHGELRQLPRAARQQQSAIAEGADAAGLRLLPRREPPPHTAAAAWFHQELQPGLHQLPLTDSRIEPPLG